jgi:hypothetical protein
VPSDLISSHLQERFVKLEPIADARVAVRMLPPSDPRGLRSIVALRDYAVGDTIFVNGIAHIAGTVNVTYAFPAVQAEFVASIVGACALCRAYELCIPRG